jgi:hypothetical protein
MERTGVTLALSRLLEGATGSEDPNESGCEVVAGRGGAEGSALHARLRV